VTVLDNAAASSVPLGTATRVVTSRIRFLATASLTEWHRRGTRFTDCQWQVARLPVTGSHWQ